MKPTKLSHLLFSLAVVTALVLAAIPMAPVHAMGASSSSQAAAPSVSDDAPASIQPRAVVCHSVTFWRHGHRVTIRVCHRVPR